MRVSMLDFGTENIKGEDQIKKSSLQTFVGRLLFYDFILKKSENYIEIAVNL